MEPPEKKYSNVNYVKKGFCSRFTLRRHLKIHEKRKSNPKWNSRAQKGANFLITHTGEVAYINKGENYVEIQTGKISTQTGEKPLSTGVTSVKCAVCGVLCKDNVSLRIHRKIKSQTCIKHKANYNVVKVIVNKLKTVQGD